MLPKSKQFYMLLNFGLSAEEKFREAGEEVEDGDIPDAEEASKEAEELYRSAELASIKVLYLG